MWGKTRARRLKRLRMASSALQRGLGGCRGSLRGQPIPLTC
nr:MAG TPA: hypothetical protein [Caudoviricetes sp.]